MQSLWTLESDLLGESPSLFGADGRCGLNADAVHFASTPGFPHFLLDIIDEGGPSSFATVQKLLERLSAKGFVARERSGGVHVYRALVGRDELAGRWLEAMAQKLGEESLTPLLTHLVSSQRLSKPELQELRALLDQLLKKSQRRNPRS